MKRPYKRKLTLWFTGDTKPMRPGPYQASTTGSKHRRGAATLWCYWNGVMWGMAARKLEDACTVQATRTKNTNQSLAWRGRTQP